MNQGVPVELDKLSKHARSAAMRFGTAGWGQVGSVNGGRYSERVRSQSRRRCNCGCKQRATHIGMSNGVALITGGELEIRRWVKSGRSARLMACAP